MPPASLAEPVNLTIDMPQEVSAVVLRFRHEPAAADAGAAGSAEYESWSAGAREYESWGGSVT